LEAVTRRAERALRELGRFERRGERAMRRGRRELAHEVRVAQREVQRLLP
jgi:hypothetical protein